MLYSILFLTLPCPRKAGHEIICVHFCLNNGTSPFVLLTLPWVTLFFLNTLTVILVHSVYSFYWVHTLCQTQSGVREMGWWTSLQMQPCLLLSLHPSGRWGPGELVDGPASLWAAPQEYKRGLGGTLGEASGESIYWETWLNQRGWDLAGWRMCAVVGGVNTPGKARVQSKGSGVPGTRSHFAGLEHGIEGQEMLLGAGRLEAAEEQGLQFPRTTPSGYGLQAVCCLRGRCSQPAKCLNEWLCLKPLTCPATSWAPTNQVLYIHYHIESSQQTCQQVLVFPCHFLNAEAQQDFITCSSTSRLLVRDGAHRAPGCGGCATQRPEPHQGRLFPALPGKMSNALAVFQDSLGKGGQSVYPRLMPFKVPALRGGCRSIRELLLV